MYTENNRLEDDAPEDEEDGQRRRKRPKKNMVKDNVDQSGTYQSHPLKVILVIYNDEDFESKPSKLIALRFEYLVKLHVICVGIEDAEGSDNNILCNLFPNDTGMELPHQVNVILFPLSKLISGIIRHLCTDLEILLGDCVYFYADVCLGPDYLFP